MKFLLKSDVGRDRRTNVISECFIHRWEESEVGRWQRWEDSEVASWERWERWESGEVGR